MASNPVQDLDQARKLRQLARLAAEIATAALTAEMATERHDWDVLDATLASLTELHDLARVAYRELLAAGIRAAG